MERIYEREREPRISPGSRRGQSRRPKPRSEWMDVLLFYVLPFIVVNGILFLLVASRPHITIQVAGTKDYNTAQASVTITSFLPIKELASAQEGAPLELIPEKRNHYTIEISQNGVIEIYAKSINGMTAIQYEHVNILDDTAPSVNDQYSIQDGLLTFTLADSQSGLDYLSVYAVNPAGESIPPLSVDRQTGSFTFDMGEQTLIIHAKDLAGNEMQATFSTHMETLNPDGTFTEQEALSGETSPENSSGNPVQANPPAENNPVSQAQGSLSPETAQASETASPSPSRSGNASLYIDTTAP